MAAKSTSRSLPPRATSCAAGLLVATVLLAGPAYGDSWYQHYERAERALAEGSWEKAVEQLEEAIRRRGDSGVRVRTYGMRTTDYFPYLKLGTAYYHLGQLDAALQAFATEERLEAIASSDSAREELQRMQSLVEDAAEDERSRARERIAEIVEQSLASARARRDRGDLDGAIDALGSALAVSPEHPDALKLMEELQNDFRRREEAHERERRAGQLLSDARLRLAEGRYGEASSLLRQALAAKPRDPEIEALLDQARRGLRQTIESRRSQDRQELLAEALSEAERLVAQSEIEEALDRLQTVLAVDPDHRPALDLQQRMLTEQARSQQERQRQSRLDDLFAEGEQHFSAGRFAEALAAANGALALDRGNQSAIELVGRSYREINRRLLGAGERSNLPPAISFADFREESEDGARVQIVRAPGLTLSGMVIDDGPVEIEITDGEGMVIEPTVSSRPLGELVLTEFQVVTRLDPGSHPFRLVATDLGGVTSSSEYHVDYDRPLRRSPVLYAALAVALLGAGGGWLLQRERLRAAKRRRRYNPYVAGAPVLDDNLFFGRDRLVDRILQTVHNNSLLLYGERRIGKTSLQHHLKKRLELIEDPDYAFYPVLIDLQGVPEESFFRLLAEEVRQELAPILDRAETRSQDEETAVYSYRDLVRDLRNIFRQLHRHTDKQVKLVLLIDEVDELNDFDPRINQRLRSLFMKSFAESLVAVVSGVEIKRQWEREGSPWYNFFEEIEIRPLTPEDAAALIERPLQGVLKVDGGVVDRVFELTEGRPYLIQRLCIALVNRAYESGRGTIGLEDVAALESLVQPQGA